MTEKIVLGSNVGLATGFEGIEVIYTARPSIAEPVQGRGLLAAV
jgi:hypothetical protein